MEKISVEEKEQTDDTWIFEVKVGKEPDTTTHTVTLSKEYWEKLTGGSEPKEDLIKKSFEFLLEREPKESILREFDLPRIQQYFKDYETEVKS